MLTPHMTRPQGDDLAAMQADTAHGMAFWAGSGPAGKTCRECASWATSKSYKRDDIGGLCDRRCRKYRAMSGGINGGAIPHLKAACKYFSPAEKAPPLIPTRGKNALKKGDDDAAMRRQRCPFLRRSAR